MDSKTDSFRILAGPSERISLDATPFHSGWWYYCTDTFKVYIDLEIDGVGVRKCINESGVPVFWGTEQAGKSLCVGQDGNVALADGPEQAPRTWGDLLNRI